MDIENRKREIRNKNKMTNSHELALPRFKSAHLAKEDLFNYPEKKGFPIFYFIPFAIFALLFFICLPKQESVETNYTSESLLTVANQDRENQRLPHLVINERLSQAAHAKALDIFKEGYFAHVSPEGLKPWDFIKNQGFKYAFAGENLALNYISAYELQDDFMQSPSHRENLLSPVFSDIGIAIVSGIYQGQPAIITVQMFARPIADTLTQNN